MISRVSLLGAGLVAALVLGACGGAAHTSVSARDEPTTTTTTSSSTTPSTTVAPSTASPASTSTASGTLSGYQTVEYRGLRFQVPDGWPVYDLAKDPTRCVRFDQHAVYLGHAGANQSCPAKAVGRVDAVQVEPIDDTSRTTEQRATTPSNVNGLQAREDPSSPVTHSIVAAFDGKGVVATITFPNDDATAQKILGTFEPAGS
jgi:hypothetical protein